MLTPSSINRAARILIVDDEPHICAAASALGLAGLRFFKQLETYGQ